ncbi:MAG: hypothetical protein Q8865_02135 [Bacillota bacterium]|nr:hypothetical protein [Bacillota bacterium]
MKKIDNSLLKQHSVNQLKQDERSANNARMACAWAVLATYAYILIEIIVKASIGKLQNMGWDFGLIMLITAVLIFARKDRAEAMLPWTITHKRLPTGTSAKEKHVRYKQYAIKSGVWAALFSLLEASLNYGLKFDYYINHSLGIIVNCIFFFVIIMTGNFLLGEHFVKRYNKICSKLEEESEKESDD